MRTNLTEGPFGIPMTDGQARSLEARLNGLPKEYKYQKRAALAETTDLVPGERADISLVSTHALDREGDVVIAKGVQLDWFRENPVVTLAHKYDELPVGKAKWIKVVQRGLLAKTQYASRPPDWQGPWLPDAIFSMTQEGILRGKSVGFLPTQIRPATKAEIGVNPEWKHARGVIEECLLLEYAVAPIPVNQEALTLAVSKGLADVRTLKRLGLPLPPRTVIDPATYLAKYLDPERINALVARYLQEM